MGCCESTDDKKKELSVSDQDDVTARDLAGEAQPMKSVVLSIGSASSKTVGDEDRATLRASSSEIDLDAVLEASSSLPCKFGCGKPAAPGTTRKGNPFDTCCRACALNKGIGVHDGTCGGACGSTPAKSRQACKKGSRCRNRSADHLAELAHPLDKDYASACATTKDVEAEQLTLKVLFDWTDADGSGKLSREELVGALGAIADLCGDILPTITEEAWHHLDEDGNGVVNFHEFASWAGPRLGLPLGVAKMIARASSVCSMSMPCTVMGCPCECYEPDSGGISKMIPSLRRCKGCKHKMHLHHQSGAAESEVPFPDYWTNTDGTFGEIHDMDGAIKDFQKLVDDTYVNKFTRDRQKHNPTKPQVPSGFKVVNVRRNENSHNFVEYGCRRAELITRIQEDVESGTEPLEIFDKVKSMVAWKKIGGAKADRLLHECNEWYVFHGTNPDAAISICENDFTVSRAGTNTGTLYGKGMYFAESVTKADEYAKPNSSGVYAMLLCRVLGGRVLYNDEVTPDPEKLVQSCIEGNHDSVLGDREKCRNTFKEFILYDSEDVYPEYIVEYRRIYKE